ncbi:polysaccharide lyase family 7 protein [Aquimarina pacifica]|uniref:polysaccharide lyase family 7 protein n=1 Tax=Aquimarina pacifica TaxID=1296415 RepID=UPI000472E898|nr:polysaccharide lyase family 7 protein [Aquimarina pacifica]
MEILLLKIRKNLFDLTAILLVLSFFLLSIACSNEELPQEDEDTEIVGGGDTDDDSTGDGENEEETEEEEEETEEEEEENEEEEEEETDPATIPSDILDTLSEWKITFPLDASGKDSATDSETGTDCDDRNNNAYEIKDITGEIPSPYSDYFYVNGDEVIFKAHCGGATTSGSSYPRSELRQTPGGGSNYWSMQDYQYLDVRVRAVNLPINKPEVSMVQIHGPEDEPLRVEFRSDGQGLHVTQNEDTTKEYVLPYVLGEQLRVTVTVDNGDITCRIENESRPDEDVWEETWEAEDATGYFKVGCYTQSNMFLSSCKGSSYSDELPESFGAVAVKDLSLTTNYTEE